MKDNASETIGRVRAGDDALSARDRSPHRADPTLNSYAVRRYAMTNNRRKGKSTRPSGRGGNAARILSR